jgi:hypothetical protein
MTTINFICDENQKSKVKNGVWEIIRKHYFETVTPNSNVEYEDEGEKVYLERLDELMKSTLCKISDNEKGFLFSFDSTDEAGYAIASDVYGTNMGYHDEGLTFVNTIFKDIVKRFNDVVFDAHAECCDEYIDLEFDFSYDGKTLKINSIDIDKYDEIMKMMSPFADIEEIAKKTGVSSDIIYSFLG